MLIVYFVYINLDDITKDLKALIVSKNDLVIKEPNSYKVDYTFENFNYKISYVPYNKEELIDNEKYQVPILLNYIPDTKYDSFIKGMNQVTPSIKNQISEIRYYPNTQDEDRFLLYMNDGNYVYITLSKIDNLNKYEEIYNSLEGKKGIIYLDSGNYFEEAK